MTRARPRCMQSTVYRVEGVSAISKRGPNRCRVKVDWLHFSAITAVAADGGNGCWRVLLNPDCVSISSSSAKV